MSVTIWHNPRCSKSRQTLARIEDAGITPTIRLYLEDPPNVAELKSALAKLGLSPKDVLRTKEDAWKALDVDKNDDAAVLAAIASTPKILERPIVISGDKAAIGRPPENVDAILS